MNNTITLYVSSPYSYKDVFDVFYSCYTRYWRKPSIPFVLSTNYEANYEGVEVISSGNLDDTWVERSLPAIEKIKTKYLLLMCDDLFICNSVNEEDIKRIVEIMDNNSINFCRLNPCTKGVPLNNGKYIKKLYKTTPYARNLQIGIFNREYLISIIKEGNRSAWDIESDWQKESLSSRKEPFSDIVGVTIPIIHYIHGVQKGYLFPSAVNELRRIGICIESGRPIMSKTQEIVLKLKIFLRTVFSPHLRYQLKRSLKKIGVSFTSDY